MNIFIIVPCMGRLHHLKKTAPNLIGHSEFEYVLSDYSCPDKSGHWLKAKYPNVHIVHTEGKKQSSRVIFNKVQALNAGALEAIKLGADYLCFLDVDTIVHNGFHEWIRDNIDYDHFLISKTNQSQVPKSAQISGFVCVHKDHFLKIGMYDKQMTGWGGEDMDMRIKLFSRGGLKWKYIPYELLDPITHGDSERTKFHMNGTKEISNKKNLNHMVESFKQWSGKYPAEIINTEIGGQFYELIGMDRSICKGFVDHSNEKS